MNEIPTPMLLGMLASVRRVQRLAAERPVWATCDVCRGYADRRRDRITPMLADKVMLDGRDPSTVVDEYMNRVHGRHLDGLSV